VASRGLLVVGNSRDAIVETAKKERVDIVIVGSRGTFTLASALLPWLSQLTL
jgi:nucleotide-binding universal stress UspA family protein